MEKNTSGKIKSFSTDWGLFSIRRQPRYFALLLKVKDKRSAEFLGFYSTSSYTALIFSANLIAVKWYY